MKKLLTFVLIVMLACLFLDKVGGSDMHMQFNGDEIDGPLEWLFGLVFAGGGLLVAAIALVCAAVVTGVVLAGVGVVLIAVLALGVVLVLALSTPSLPPSFCSMRLRPPRLARYSASSARASTASQSASVPAMAAMPILTVMVIRMPPSVVSELSATRRRKRSANTAAAARSVPGSKMANSSPPTRPGTSTLRSAWHISAPKWRSTASPTAWPWSSLTRLK